MATFEHVNIFTSRVRDVLFTLPLYQGVSAETAGVALLWSYVLLKLYSVYFLRFKFYRFSAYR